MGLYIRHIFAAYDLATKLGWANGQPGRNAVEPVSTGLGTLATGLGEARHRSEQGITGLEAAWRGPASNAARESLSGTAQGMADTSTATENASARLTEYGNSFEEMRHKTAYVDPAQYSWW